MIIKTIDKAVAKVGDLSFQLSLLVTVFLVMAIIWEVANRFLFSTSSVWVSEVSGYLVALIDVLVLGLALVVGYATYDMALLSYQLNWRSSTTLAMPLFIPQMFMPIGAAVLALEAIRLLVRNICGVCRARQGTQA